MSSWINGNLRGTFSVGQGERGKSLEYEWRGTELGIRVEGEEEYNFVDLAGGSGSGSGNGVDGREIELQVGNGYLQWRYKGEDTWQNLIAISELKGEKGDDGAQGIQGLPGKDGRDGAQGLPGKDGTDGKDGINGTNGQDGYTPVKGTDYYTDAEKEELITEILNRITNGNEVAY